MGQNGDLTPYGLRPVFFIHCIQTVDEFGDVSRLGEATLVGASAHEAGIPFKAFREVVTRSAGIVSGAGELRCRRGGHLLSVSCRSMLNHAAPKLYGHELLALTISWGFFVQRCSRVLLLNS